MLKTEIKIKNIFIIYTESEKNASTKASLKYNDLVLESSWNNKTK